MKKFCEFPFKVSVTENKGTHTSVGSRYRGKVIPAHTGFPAYEPALLSSELSKFVEVLDANTLETIEIDKKYYTDKSADREVVRLDLINRQEEHVLTQVTILNSIHTLMRSVAIEEYGYDLHHALSTGAINSILDADHLNKRSKLLDYKEHANIRAVVDKFDNLRDAPPKADSNTGVPYLPYNVFTQRKKSGGYRVLHSPTDTMLHLQGKLMKDFYSVTNIDNTFSEENMSYLPGKSFVNVLRDKKLKQQFELSVDLKNYYHQIHGNRAVTAMMYAVSGETKVGPRTVLENVRKMLGTALHNVHIARSHAPYLSKSTGAEAFSTALTTDEVITGMHRAVLLACMTYDAYVKASDRKELMMFNIITDEVLDEIKTEVVFLGEQIGKDYYVEFVVNPVIKKVEYNTSTLLATLVQQLFFLSDDINGYPRSVVKSAIRKNTNQHLLFNGYTSRMWTGHAGGEGGSMGSSLFLDENGKLSCPTSSISRKKVMRHLLEDHSDGRMYRVCAYFGHRKDTLYRTYPGSEGPPNAIVKDVASGKARLLVHLMHTVSEDTPASILKVSPMGRQSIPFSYQPYKKIQVTGEKGDQDYAIGLPPLYSLLSLASNGRLPEGLTEYKSMILTPKTVTVPGIWDHFQITKATHDRTRAIVSPVIFAYLGCMAASTTALLPVNYEHTSFKDLSIEFYKEFAPTAAVGSDSGAILHLLTLLFLRAGDRKEKYFSTGALTRSALRSGMYEMINKKLVPLDKAERDIPRIYKGLTARRYTLAQMLETLEAGLGVRLCSQDDLLEVALNMVAILSIVRAERKKSKHHSFGPSDWSLDVPFITKAVLLSMEHVKKAMYASVDMRWGLPQGARTSSFLSASISEILLKEIRSQYAEYASRIPVENFDVLIYSDNLYIVYDALEGKEEKAHTTIKRIVDVSIKKVGLFVNDKKTQLFDGQKKILGLLIDRQGGIRVPRSRIYEINQIAINLAKSEHGEILYKGQLHTVDSLQRLTGLREWAKNVGRKDYSQTVFTIEKVGSNTDGSTTVTLSKGNINAVLKKKASGRKHDETKDLTGNEARTSTDS